MSGQQPRIDETDLRRIVRGIIDLFQGRGNSSGTFTCATSAASTTVTHANASANSQIMLTPTTSNAVQEYKNGTIYVSSKANGSFVVTHANSATTGRTFDYVICS